MKEIRVLDCTLRDGGCVNNFNFGSTYIQQIKKGLEQSRVDIIECGYLDEKAGSEKGRTQFVSEQAVKNELGDKRQGTLYVAMFDYGKFDPQKLLPKDEKGLDGIRIAFHKEKRFEAIEAAKIVSEKGYRVFIQPMLILRYTDAEIIELIQTVNKELPQIEAFYIVDSFGEMRRPDLERLAYLVDHNLRRDICLGYHSHNNLQLSYSNAVHLVEQNLKRHLILDSSIMGMGKGAGNLTTELLLDHLNHYYGCDYAVQPLLEIIDTVLNQIYANYRWGYSAEYFLSAMNSCTPSYAKHFFSKHLMGIDQIAELLSRIPAHKKISFDKDFADELYFQYNNFKFDDRESVKQLKKALDGKKVFLLAPGKSIVSHRETIEQYLHNDSFCSIALNVIDMFQTDFFYTNKKWIYQNATEHRMTPIVLSNITKGANEGIVLDYESWAMDGACHLETSVQVVFNILSKLGVSEIYLAGFDGYSMDIDQNYYKDDMKRMLTKNDVFAMTQQTQDAINRYCNCIKFKSVTPTRYILKNDQSSCI